MACYLDAAGYIGEIISVFLKKNTYGASVDEVYMFIYSKIIVYND